MTAAAEFRSTALSHVGKKRRVNQDFHAIQRLDHANGRYELLVLADGMGGGLKGDVASQTATQAVVQYFRAAPWYNPEEACREAAFSANRAVWDTGTGAGQATKSFMGTTLVFALFETKTNRLWIANVGDSRAYLLRGGALEQLTRDHSLVAEHAHEGRPLTPEEVARLKNVVTRAVGLEPTVQPDIIGPLEIGMGDRVLLSSDGLHGVVPNERLTKLAAGQMERAARAMVSAANAAGGPDNITVVMGQLQATEATAPGTIGPRHLIVAGVAVLVVASIATALTLSRELLPFQGASPTSPPEPTAAPPATATATPTVTASPSPSSTSPDPKFEDYTIPPSVIGTAGTSEAWTCSWALNELFSHSKLTKDRATGTALDDAFYSVVDSQSGLGKECVKREYEIGDKVQLPTCYWLADRPEVVKPLDWKCP